MWDHRNQWPHNEDKYEELLGHAALADEITWWCEQPRPYPMHPDEHSLFSLPLVTILSMPVQQRQAWVGKAQAAHNCELRHN